MARVVFHGTDVPKVVDIRPDETVFEFVRRAVGDAEVEIACFGVRDADGEVDIEALMIEVVADGNHVHYSKHCRRIVVTVRYVGPPYRSHEFKPHTSIGKVLKWAENDYAIAHDQRGQFRLKLPDVQAYLENDDLLGELIHDEPCELRLDLVRIEQNAGALR